MCTSSFIISAHSLIVFLTESTPLAIVFVALSIVYPSFLSATFVLVYIHNITNLAVCHRFFMIALCFLCECTKKLLFFSVLLHINIFIRTEKPTWVWLLSQHCVCEIFIWPIGRSHKIIFSRSIRIAIAQLCKIWAWAIIIHKRSIKSADQCEGEKIMHNDFP